MTSSDAWTRLAACRRNQPGMQVIVSADIIDALLTDRGHLRHEIEVAASILRAAVGYRDLAIPVLGDDKEAA